MSDLLQELPAELEEMPPGPGLAAVLASVDRKLLDDRGRVRLMQARHRMVAHQQAELYVDMYALTWDEPPDDDLALGEDDQPYPWAQAELAMALRWTRFAAGVRLEQARRLVEDFPAVHRALSSGLIDVPKALLIIEQVARLDPEVAGRIVDEVLKQAPMKTTGQLRVWLRRLVIAADPTTAAERAEQDVTQRRVQVGLNDNHLADLSGHDLAPHRVAASWERLNAIARAAKAAGDSRGMDQLRADALLDLLVGEGVAVGGAISYGGIGSEAPDGEVDHAGGETGETDEVVWPTAPADLDLLDPDADPHQPTPTTTPTTTAAVDVPSEPGEDPESGEDSEPGEDPEQEQLRPFWLAGFDHLATTGPNQPAAAPAGQVGTMRGAMRERMGGAMPGPRRGTIELQMSLYTLLGLDDLPAELAGFGPILADIARQVAAQRPDLRWKYSVYDQDTLLAHGTTSQRPTSIPDSPTTEKHSRSDGPDSGGRRTRRRPTTAVAEFVRARNRTCTAPGCRRSARSCELDHTVAWEHHGESEPDNLGPACPAHHHLKHSRGCHLVQSRPGGRFGWITPKGMRYITTSDPPLYHDHHIVNPPIYRRPPHLSP